ncbi:MAG: flagellar export chaperone FlgN [Myxococcales bacterium]|nr:flagellar export chaperone FlgN [Myxococcales bacterium]
MSAPLAERNGDESPALRLAALLDAQERLLLEMRDCLHAERDAMQRLDADALEEAAHAKAGIAAELRVVEDARIAVARELAAALGLADPAATLAELGARLGSGGGGLLAARDRLRALVAANAELLEANSTFASRSLDEVRTTLAWISGLQPSAPTYERSGRALRERPSGGLLDRRA